MPLCLLLGLALAHQLGKDESWLLLEAHATHYGGRIRNTPGADIDLGPAWLWPGQNEMASLLTGKTPCAVPADETFSC